MNEQTSKQKVGSGKQEGGGGGVGVKPCRSKSAQGLGRRQSGPPPARVSLGCTSPKVCRWFKSLVAETTGDVVQAAAPTTPTRTKLQAATTETSFPATDLASLPTPQFQSHEDIWRQSLEGGESGVEDLFRRRGGGSTEARDVEHWDGPGGMFSSMADEAVPFPGFQAPDPVARMHQALTLDAATWASSSKSAGKHNHNHAESLMCLLAADTFVPASLDKLPERPQSNGTLGGGSLTWNPAKLDHPFAEGLSPLVEGMRMNNFSSSLRPDDGLVAGSGWGSSSPTFSLADQLRAWNQPPSAGKQLGYVEAQMPQLNLSRSWSTPVPPPRKRPCLQRLTSAPTTASQRSLLPPTPSHLWGSSSTSTASNCSLSTVTNQDHSLSSDLIQAPSQADALLSRGHLEASDFSQLQSRISSSSELPPASASSGGYSAASSQSAAVPSLVDSPTSNTGGEPSINGPGGSSNELDACDGKGGRRHTAVMSFSELMANDVPSTPTEAWLTALPLLHKRAAAGARWEPDVHPYGRRTQPPVRGSGYKLLRPEKLTPGLEVEPALLELMASSSGSLPSSLNCKLSEADFQHLLNC